MRYEKGAKIVFCLWGILLLLSIISYASYLLGIGVSDDTAHIFDALVLQWVIRDIVLLGLIILGYKGKEWAYYGFMIFLGCTSMWALLTVGNEVVELLYGERMDTLTYVARFVMPSLSALLRGVSLYALYKYKKKEILSIIKDSQKAAKLIFPLWGVFAIIKIIGSLGYIYRLPEHTILFENEFHLNVFLLIVYSLILGFAVLEYEGKRWTYKGFMISLGCGLVGNLWKIAYRYHGLTDLRCTLSPEVETVAIFTISLYILYKNPEINDVFGAEPSD